MADAPTRYLECRGQRELHPRDLLFWIERASLPQCGDIFELAKGKSFFLLEYILMARAMIAVASPHYFSRGWCLFEFASKLATAPDTNPAALGIAWKAFVSFGSRLDPGDESKIACRFSFFAGSAVHLTDGDARLQ